MAPWLLREKEIEIQQGTAVGSRWAKARYFQWELASFAVIPEGGQLSKQVSGPTLHTKHSLLSPLKCPGPLIGCLLLKPREFMKK